MNYNERLSNVAVLGAAGKMGSGIVLLTVIEMANRCLIEGKDPCEASLHAIDVSPSALNGLMKYLRTQVLKSAEKSTIQLRKWYSGNPALIENEEIINRYVMDVLSVVKPSTRMEAAWDAYVIFEAVSENPDLKVKLFSSINEHNPNQPWFLTNTSSIPIGELNKKAGLNGNIIGLHYYNPPAIQKLLEIITPAEINPHLVEFANQLAGNLQKTVVHANDVAGFIGNGFFMRDILFAVNETMRLTKEMSLPQALYVVDKVSRDYLVRPMGIFQLSDYVGIDVCVFIMAVMNERLTGENVQCSLFEQLMKQEVMGGQFADGNQKDGIFKYIKGQIVAVYDLNTKQYIELKAIADVGDSFLGPMPASWQPWKLAIKSRTREIMLQQYFDELKQMQTTGAVLAKAYAINAKQIGQQLVRNGVAHKTDDVNTVMTTGFFHAFGPVNDYL
ncbi:MAG: 3-hydroxyacyl-CoA dehydrogenase family protein [Bacteroidales bacterium]|nr:3-hydroxyacyl-CoA dehydrogenase family protein [Bacteroidales bacterium]MDZ4203323.1 3-hydroxyacyl-CoA dehydrogenase family protein [Bacteroidales bacterium]